jgi:hypothetical protein
MVTRKHNCHPGRTRIIRSVASVVRDGSTDLARETRDPFRDIDNTEWIPTLATLGRDDIRMCGDIAR